MNIDLKEIRRMVTTALIQESVGYHGGQVDGHVGEIADAPDIAAMVDAAGDAISNLEMAKTNAAQAALADATEELVGPLIQAGLSGDEVKEMLENLYSTMMDKIDRHTQAASKEADETRVDLEPPPTGE
tara:strand:- start:3507 stop:3893 length:387 start_codon:yes stop_codon:yes gene_type:complete